jgi:hypothetical protein
MWLFDEKNQSRKSRHTVSLRVRTGASLQLWHHNPVTQYICKITAVSWTLSDYCTVDLYCTSCIATPQLSLVKHLIAFACLGIFDQLLQGQIGTTCLHITSLHTYIIGIITVYKWNLCNVLQWAMLRSSERIFFTDPDPSPCMLNTNILLQMIPDNKFSMDFY